MFAYPWDNSKQRERGQDIFFSACVRLYNFNISHTAEHGRNQTWQKSGWGVLCCVGRFQLTRSPFSFTISPIIKGKQPRNYQSVNYWDAAWQIQLLIETQWLPLTTCCCHPHETRDVCEQSNAMNGFVRQGRL